jgi:hypothetical protein
MSREFLANAKRLLGDSGVFVMNLAAYESDSARMSQLIRAEFGAPVMSVTVGWGSNAIAFAGPALNDVDRLRAVSTRARQIHDELGLDFQRLPALVNEYLQKVQAKGAIP